MVLLNNHLWFVHLAGVVDLGKLYTYFLHCQAINHFTTSDFFGKPLLLLSSSYKRGPYLYSYIDVGVNPFNNKENDLWNKDTDRESLGYVCTHPFDECRLKRARFMQRKLAICRSFLFIVIGWYWLLIHEDFRPKWREKYLACCGNENNSKFLTTETSVNFIDTTICFFIESCI